jgi:hypothetical protein
MALLKSEMASKMASLRQRLEELREYKRILIEDGERPDAEDKMLESDLIQKLLGLEKDLARMDAAKGHNRQADPKKKAMPRENSKGLLDGVKKDLSKVKPKFVDQDEPQGRGFGSKRRDKGPKKAFGKDKSWESDRFRKDDASKGKPFAGNKADGEKTRISTPNKPSHGSHPQKAFGKDKAWDSNRFRRDKGAAGKTFAGNKKDGEQKPGRFKPGKPGERSQTQKSFGKDKAWESNRFRQDEGTVGKSFAGKKADGEQKPGRFKPGKPGERSQTQKSFGKDKAWSPNRFRQDKGAAGKTFAGNKEDGEQKPGRFKPSKPGERSQTQKSFGKDKAWDSNRFRKDEGAAGKTFAGKKADGEQKPGNSKPRKPGRDSRPQKTKSRKGPSKKKPAAGRTRVARS